MSKPFEDAGFTDAQISKNYTWKQVKINSDNIDTVQGNIDGLIFSDIPSLKLLANNTDNTIVTAGNNLSAFGNEITVEDASASNAVLGHKIRATNSNKNVVVSSNDAVSSTVIENADNCVILGNDSEILNSDRCINIGGFSDISLTDDSISLGYQNNVVDSDTSISIGNQSSTNLSSGNVAVGHLTEIKVNSANCVSIQGNTTLESGSVENSVGSIAIGSNNNVFESDASIQVGANADMLTSDRSIQIGRDSNVTQSDDSILIGNGNDQLGGPSVGEGDRVIKIGHELNLDGTGENYICISQQPFGPPLAPQLPAPGSIIIGAGQDTVSALPKIQFLGTSMETLKNNVAPGAAYVDYDGLANFVPGNANGWLRMKYQGFNIRWPIHVDSDTANAPP